MRTKKSIFQTSPFGWDKISGVYCICTGGLNYITFKRDPLKVWYVGSAKDIGKRLTNSNHPYILLQEKGFVPFVRYIETLDYVKLEKRIISLLNPPMNKQHVRHASLEEIYYYLLYIGFF